MSVRHVVVIVLAACVGVVGCSTGPKGYSLTGSWQASGGALDGGVFSVEQQKGDSVSGCQNVPNAASLNFVGSVVGRSVALAEVLQGDSGTVLEFTGQFVNAREIQGTVGGSGPTITLSPYTGGGLLTCLDN